MSDDDAARCERCNWPIAERIEDGCVLGNCSQRPVPPMRGETYQRRHDAPPRALSDGDLTTIRATLDARRYVEWYDIECLLLTIAAAREEGRRAGLEEAAKVCEAFAASQFGQYVGTGAEVNGDAVASRTLAEAAARLRALAKEPR